MSHCILLVDDEARLRQALQVELRAEGYAVVQAGDGDEALRALDRTPPDLVVLDLGLPDIDGLEVCRAVRERSRCPIVVLSARATEQDKVQALDRGADDYITKPFGIDELLARVRAHLRRWQDQPGAHDPVLVGALEIQPLGREVTLDGKPLHLTPTEYELLLFFSRHPGRVLTHEMLLEHLRGVAYQADVQTLRVHVANLRKKIERDPARPHLLVTELGVGYRFNLPG